MSRYRLHTGRRAGEISSEDDDEMIYGISDDDDTESTVSYERGVFNTTHC